MDKSAIEVALRIRGCLDGEESVPDNFLVLDEEKCLVQVKNNPYKFDQVFNVNVKNEVIYNSLVAEKISKILQGYNVTILAYGATGSGKTYTMGTSLKASNPGLIPLALKNIFESLEAVSDSDRAVVKASYLELYMEEIKDLINQDNVCSLRGEAEDLKIVGLSENIIECEEDAFKLLETGNHARKTEATAKNTQSSRSHAIFIVTISLIDKITGIIRKSKFQLVDLAGSERSKMTKTCGETFKQGININKSLSTLGRVILCIIKKEKHIPYRDSILTRILQDSLGGNSYTVLVACINLVQSSAEETLNTLRYADSAKNIKNTPTINKEEEEKNIQQLKREISLLKSELAEIKEKAPLKHSVDFYKMNALSESFREYWAMADVKFTETYEKMKSLFSFLGGTICEFAGKASTNTSVADILEKLEYSQEELKKLLEEIDVFKNEQLTLSSTPNVSLNTTFKVSSDEPMDTDEKESYDTCPESFSEEAKQLYAETAVKLENLEKMILIKESSVKSCKDLQPLFDVNCNEDAYQALIEKLNVLSEDLNRLLSEKQLLKAEELAKEKDLKEKIKLLENEINRLQSDIRRSDVLMDIKRKSKEKENFLKKEILTLKQSKVQLLKQQKLESGKLKRQAIDESKKRAVLEKNYRKITFEKEKMRSGFEKKINVLKQKLDIIQKQKKKSQPTRIKDSTEDFKKEISLDEVLAQVDELLAEVTTQEIITIELENYELEMQSLVQQLNSIEDKKEKSDSDENFEAGKCEEKNIKNNLEECVNKIKEIKNDDFKKNSSSTNFDWIPTDSSKKVIQHIVKKYVSNEVDSARKINILSSDLQKKDCLIEDLQSTTQKLKSSVAVLQIEIEDMKRENEKQISNLEREWETKILLVLENHRKISEKAQEESAKSSEVNEIQSFEDEMWNKRNELFDSFKEREKLKKENEELREQLSKAKMKSEPKLMPLIGTENIKVKKEKIETHLDSDMVGVFLTDADESVISIGDEAEERDPDWRATPVHRRRKTQMKRKLPEDIQVPQDVPQKKASVGCSCPGNCSTKRCSCKKKKIDCTVNCDCNNKIPCLNSEGGRDHLTALKLQYAAQFDF